jgi:alpha-L-rhamnosidase
VWPSNIAILPEIHYDLYGDRRILEANYSALARWMKFVSRHLKSDFTVDLQKFGDWCDAYSMDGGPDTGGTPDSLIATAYYFNNCKIAARIARLLDRPDDVIRFEELAAKIRDGFHQRFYDEKNYTYGPGTQTCDVLPLAFDMVPAQHRAAVAEHLAHQVMVERGGHLSVGMVGAFWLMQVLTDTGHGDVAWTVATKTTRPSWGYMLSKGATTIWERWDTDTRGPGMNSESLLILAGNLNAWFYQTLAGIHYDKENPGFKHIILKPQPLGDLSHVKASLNTQYGSVASAWKIEKGSFVWNVIIPPNTTATVHVPAKNEAEIMESGMPTGKANGLKYLRMENNAAVFEVGSGIYEFHSTLEN